MSHKIIVKQINLDLVNFISQYSQSTLLQPVLQHYHADRMREFRSERPQN